MSSAPQHSAPRTARKRFRRLAALAAPLAVALAAWAVTPNGAAQASAARPALGLDAGLRRRFQGGSGSGIDGQWMYDTGPGSNFGTGEIETMTNSTSNVHLDGNGNLDITALGSGSNWTSGRVQTTSANVGAPAGGKLEVTASIQQTDRRPRLLAGVLDARAGPVAGERRDRHHGGRQRALRGGGHHPLRHRPRRPVQRGQRHRQRAARLRRLPVRLPHLHDDPRPDEHLERVDHLLPGRHAVLHASPSGRSAPRPGSRPSTTTCRSSSTWRWAAASRTACAAAPRRPAPPPPAARCSVDYVAAYTTSGGGGNPPPPPAHRPGRSPSATRPVPGRPAPSTANFNPVQIYTCNGTNAQQWTVVQAGSTLHVTRQVPGHQRRRDRGRHDRRPVRLQQHRSAGVHPAVERDRSTTRSPTSAWTTPGCDRASGTQVQIWDCTGTSNQKWTLP